MSYIPSHVHEISISNTTSDLISSTNIRRCKSQLSLWLFGIGSYHDNVTSIEAGGQSVRSNISHNLCLQSTFDIAFATCLFTPLSGSWKTSTSKMTYMFPAGSYLIVRILRRTMDIAWHTFDHFEVKIQRCSRAPANLHFTFSWSFNWRTPKFRLIPFEYSGHLVDR